MIATGERTERIRFERRSADLVTPVGQLGRVWESMGNRWARIEPQPASRPESETSAGQDQSIVRYVVSCEGYIDVRAEDRIVHAFDGRAFGISQVYSPDGRAPAQAHELEILAFIADQMEESK